MTRVVPPPVIFGVAYFVAAALPIWATRLEGGVAFLWIASALLTAKLRMTPREAWRPWLFSAAIASALATGLFGLGWAAAPALMLFNIVDAVLAERVLHSLEKRRGPISMERDGLLLSFACFVGALVTAVPAAAVAQAVTGTSLSGNSWNWIVSHTLGSLTFGPFMAICMRGQMWPWLVRIVRMRDYAVPLFVVVLATTTVIAFEQDSFSLLFLPVLALVLLTYRTGLPGTAIGNVLLAVFGAAALLLGERSSIFGGPAATFQFLLFFLGMTVLVILPISAVISARQEMLERVRASEDGYRMLADNIEDVVISCDVTGRLTYASPSFRGIRGEDPAQALGKLAVHMIDPRFHAAARKTMRKMIAARGMPMTFEFVAAGAGAQERWFEWRGRSVRRAPGQPLRVIATIRETTQRKSMERALRSAAESDPLTGLLNRRAFLSVAQSVASSSSSNWLALFDLDHLNAINTYVGNEAGDIVLKTFASVAQRSIRDGDLVGRLEDDAFGLLLRNVSAEAAQATCGRVLAGFAGSQITHSGRVVAASASAGLSALAADLDETLRSARSALDQSRASGGAKLSFAA